MNHMTAQNFNSFDGVPYWNRLIENYSPNESKYVRCADVYEVNLGCDKENRSRCKYRDVGPCAENNQWERHIVVLPF